MDRTNIQYLEQQLSRVMADQGKMNTRFMVEIDPDEQPQPKTNTDEIMFHWVLPKKTGKIMELKEVCETLVAAQNEIPLWIKMHWDHEDKICLLRISKRFRKLGVVQEWHQDNDLCPIILEYP